MLTHTNPTKTQVMRAINLRDNFVTVSLEEIAKNEYAINFVKACTRAALCNEDSDVREHFKQHLREIRSEQKGIESENDSDILNGRKIRLGYGKYEGDDRVDLYLLVERSVSGTTTFEQVLVMKKPDSYKKVYGFDFID